VSSTGTPAHALAALAIALAQGACDSDAGDADAARVPDAAAIDDAPRSDAAPPSRERLSEVGLYADIDEKILADGVIEFAPTHALWSDGAVKTRWIALPAGTQIDTSDMNRWQFPVGTKFFKEFVRDDVRVETRMIEKLGDGPMDYWMGAFIWELDESDAVFAVDGGADVNGTDHDVPDAETCWTCHLGEPTRTLGFSAIQLSRPVGDITLLSIAADGWLTDPPAAGVDYPVPGDAVVAAALGYLHANCGHCHNPSGTSWPDTSMHLRLRVEDRAPEDTTIYTTTVDVPLDRWLVAPFTSRVVPGSSSLSAIVVRMSNRGTMDEMPPIATELTDPTGLDAVTTWIDGL